MARQNVEYTDTLRQGTDKWNANDTEEYSDIAAAAAAAAAAQSNIDTHEGLTNNPHSVTKSQVGLSNADDTSDITKALTLEGTAKTDDFTFALADVGVVTRFNKATPIVGTIPLDASVDFPIGTNIELSSIAAGAATVAATGGVTLTSSSGNFIIPAPLTFAGNLALLRKTAANTWKLYNGPPPLTWEVLTPTQTGIASGLGHSVKYIIEGKSCRMLVSIYGTGNTLDAITITNMPFVAASTRILIIYVNNAATQRAGRAQINVGTSTLTITATEAGGAFTDNGYREANFEMTFDIA